MKIKKAIFIAVVIMAGCFTACGAEKKAALSDYLAMTSKEEQSGGIKEKEKQEVVLGSDFEKDCDGFAHLYCEVLVSESTQSEEIRTAESSIQVLIPDGDYAGVNKDSAYASKYGVKFRVTLNPYPWYDGDDYTLEKDLEYFLTFVYDEFYNTSYKEIEISDVVRNGNGVRASVSYLLHDEWQDKYIPIFCTYFFVKLDEETTVFVEVEVDADNVTKETETLLEELEAFYGFDIAWDAKEAKKKLDRFMVSGAYARNICSTGYILFELPADWKQDLSYTGSGYVFAYAPEGDVGQAGCMISISREYVGTDSTYIREMLKDTEQIKAIFEEQLGEKAKDIEVTDYGATCLGDAVRVSTTMQDDFGEGRAELYFIADENYLYCIQASAAGEQEGDVFAITEDILKNGKVKQR